MILLTAYAVRGLPDRYPDGAGGTTLHSAARHPLIRIIRIIRLTPPSNVASETSERRMRDVMYIPCTSAQREAWGLIAPSLL